MRDVAEQFPQTSSAEQQLTLLPLVIDLDGALLATDFVKEALLDPSKGQYSLYSTSGEDDLQRKVSLDHAPAGSSDLDYAHLPYREEVIERARRARAEGKAVYLITAADQSPAIGIASHIGLFKGVISSTIDRTLTEQTKADILIREFGSKAFDYVGGASCDQRILAAAACGITISTDRNYNKIQPRPVRALASVPLSVWFSAVRIHQSAKNLLVFVPLLTSHQFSLANLLNLALAFAAFSLCASAVYLLNDLVDLKADQAHPRKRFRAIASGQLSAAAATTAIALLLGVSIPTALAASPAFAGILLGYFALTTAYTFYLKRLVIVDIVVLASLYTLRIVAGAVAIQVYLSEWLLIFSMFIFTSLALIKRHAELAMRQEASLADAGNRDYGVGDMQIVAALAAASGMNAITIMSLYLSSPAVLALYHRPAFLWLLDPLLIYWIARALMLAHRRQLNHDPVVFALRDGPSRIVGLLMVMVVLTAI
jgi:4-hydroxybenzoate polyprenyltransferase